MKQDLQGKVLVLTGAGGGIGRAIALRMAQCGMKLVLLGGRNVSKLQETQALVEKCSQCIVLPGELTDMDALDKLVEKAASAFGGIDVLVNNAGVAQSTPFDHPARYNTR